MAKGSSNSGYTPGNPPSQGTKTGKMTNNGGFGKASDSKGGSKTGGTKTKQ